MSILIIPTSATIIRRVIYTIISVGLVIIQQNNIKTLLTKIQTTNNFATKISCGTYTLNLAITCSNLTTPVTIAKYLTNPDVQTVTKFPNNKRRAMHPGKNKGRRACYPIRKWPYANSPTLTVTPHGDVGHSRANTYSADAIYR